MSKVKLYLNENLSWRIAKSLRGYGYDVVSSHENEMNSESDECQFDYAISMERAVVTNNFRDFAILHRKYIKEYKRHYGIVFTTKCSISTMIKRLRTFIESVSQEQLMNQIIWLNDYNFKV